MASYRGGQDGDVRVPGRSGDEGGGRQGQSRRLVNALLKRELDQDVDARRTTAGPDAEWACRAGSAARLVSCCWPSSLTWPLVLSPALDARGDRRARAGDPYLNLWILGWDLQTIADQPSSLFNLRIFDANIFHPARQTLTYSDNFLLQAIAADGRSTRSPATSGPLLQRCCSSARSSPARSRCSRSSARVTGSALGRRAWRAPCGASGRITSRISVHLQLQALYLMPLTFLFLHRRDRQPTAAGTRSVSASPSACRRSRRSTTA